jgi:hypothetical protein
MDRSLVPAVRASSASAWNAASDGRQRQARDAKWPCGNQPAYHSMINRRSMPRPPPCMPASHPSAGTEKAGWHFASEGLENGHDSSLPLRNLGRDRRAAVGPGSARRRVESGTSRCNALCWPTRINKSHTSGDARPPWSPAPKPSQPEARLSAASPPPVEVQGRLPQHVHRARGVQLPPLTTPSGNPATSFTRHTSFATSHPRPVSPKLTQVGTNPTILHALVWKRAARYKSLGKNQA